MPVASPASRRGRCGTPISDPARTAQAKRDDTEPWAACPASRGGCRGIPPTLAGSETGAPAARLATTATCFHEHARRRFLETEPAPLFLGDWIAPMFLHFAVPADVLQPHCAFPLDLWEGEAAVSLVAFTMSRFRFARGGRLGAWLCAPFREMQFLNLRAYVVVNGEPGITFLSEWVSNWLHVQVGPFTHGLPYRWGGHDFRHPQEAGCWSGRVFARGGGAGELRYTVHAQSDDRGPAAAGSFDEFLLERHTCYLHRGNRGQMFRIWHPSWPQAAATAKIEADSLLSGTAPWWDQARLVGANVSPGVREVWMGRPRRIPV